MQNVVLSMESLLIGSTSSDSYYADSDGRKNMVSFTKVNGKVEVQGEYEKNVSYLYAAAA